MMLFQQWTSPGIQQDSWWRRWISCFFSWFSCLRPTKYSCLSVLLVSVLFSSCSGINLQGNTVATPRPKPTPTATTLNLAQVPWCGHPVTVFRNLASSGTPGVTSGPATTLSNWAQAKPLLGFTVYLPATLPNGSCLVSASGTVRDPILGSNFVIGYVLPDHSTLTLSQAPQRSQNATFQCALTSTNVAKTTSSGGAVQVCSGARGTTSIVFSARGNTDALQQFFNALQPDVNWVPAS